MSRTVHNLITLLILCASTQLWSVSLDCDETLRALVYEIQRATLGDVPDAVVQLKKRLGETDTQPTAEQKNNPKGIFAFESDVLQLIALSPNLRRGAINAFKEKWGLNSDDLLDVLTYYSTRVFYDEPALVADPRKVFTRLQQVAREHFLSNPENHAAQHFIFYQSNLTQLSVPEMAKRLGISEGEVYRELSQTGLSPVAAFDEPLTVHQRRSLETWLGITGRSLTPNELDASVAEIARMLTERGVNEEHAAAALGIGYQALKFYRHHTGEQNRGVAWTRSALFEGRQQWEASIAVTLRERNFTAQEIADELNRLFQTGPEHPHTRTAQSVSSQFKILGLTESPAKGASEIYDPEYGYLKRSGKLVPENALKYVFDHSRFDDATLARHLGVEPTSLREFFERHFVVRTDPSTRSSFLVQRESGNKALDLLGRYARQEEAVDHYLDWVARNGRLPLASEYGKDELNFSQQKLFGSADYREGKQNGHLRYFDNLEQALLAIRDRARERKIPFNLIDVHSKNKPSDLFKRELRKEAIDRYLDWVKAHGKNPELSDFHNASDGVGLHSGQLFGAGIYRADRQNGEHRYFDSKQEAMLAAKARARERGIPFFLIDNIYQGTLSSELRAEIKKEAVDRYLDWQLRNGRTPISSDFGTSEGKLHLSTAQFFGVGSYDKNTGALKGLRIFDDVEETMLALRDRATERKIPFSLLDRTYMHQVSEPFLNLLREEAIDKYFDWVGINKRHPMQKDFGGEPGQLHMDYQSWFGAKAERGKGIVVLFPNTEAALLRIRDESISRNIPFSLLDRKYNHEFSSSFREELKKEAVDRYLDWVVENNQFPKTSDYGAQPGQLHLSYGQFFGTSAYKLGSGPKQRARYFDSREAAEAAIAARAKERGIVLPAK